MGRAWLEVAEPCPLNPAGRIRPRAQCVAPLAIPWRAAIREAILWHAGQASVFEGIVLLFSSVCFQSFWKFPHGDMLILASHHRHGLSTELAALLHFMLYVQKKHANLEDF